MLSNPEVGMLPTAIVIFGGTGHLAETKLLPALYDLYLGELLPETFVIVGLSRKELSHADYQAFVAQKIKEKGAVDEMELDNFVKNIKYVQGNFSDIKAYDEIKEILLAFDGTLNICSNKLFYLAVPPSLYSDIFSKLKESGAMSLCDSNSSWSRLLVEKPFGSDLNTAKALEAQLCELFSEEQIYRIDHYLAKDAIENILSLRFANSILADSWNGTRIESIDLRLFETADVYKRGAFYDGIGALRDVGQNHLLQILALLIMEPVDVHQPEAVRRGRLAVLESLVRQVDDEIIRGQYQGYQETTGVAPGSQTETYFKIKTHLSLPAWNDVLVTLESGKALNQSLTEVVMTFRAIDKCQCAAFQGEHTHQNILKMSFSPEQSIRLTMWVKEPGFKFKLHKRELVLAEAEGESFRSPEAYERVLYDCIIGDQTRFVSGPEVMAAWNFITPIIEELKNKALHSYMPGATPPITNETI